MVKPCGLAFLSVSTSDLWRYKVGAATISVTEFAFAIAFGMFFQYYSIAPMSGDYVAKTMYRAAKADVLSLLSVEIGLFAWMAIFQIAIFRWRLPITTVTYWWMMQVYGD